MNYNQIYQRNIGLFTEEEQLKLKNAKVAVAGVGGVGSYQAVALVRLGVGSLNIMDPGVFDEPDMNRQYGALVSTIGVNKAAATAKMLMDMNPELKLEVFTSPANTPSEVDAFISGASLVVDAIDYAGFRHKSLLHEQARKKGLYILSGPIPAYGASLQIFSPSGMTVEEFYGAPDNRDQWDTFRIPITRTAPKKSIPQVLFDFEQGKIPYLSTNGASAQLAGGMLAMEAALMITGKRGNEQVVVPNMLYIDFLKMEYVKCNPLLEEQLHPFSEI